jgi:hypothetical protein
VRPRPGRPLCLLSHRLLATTKDLQPKRLRPGRLRLRSLLFRLREGQCARARRPHRMRAPCRESPGSSTAHTTRSFSSTCAVPRLEPKSTIPTRASRFECHKECFTDGDIAVARLRRHTGMGLLREQNEKTRVAQLLAPQRGLDSLFVGRCAK